MKLIQYSYYFLIACTSFFLICWTVVNQQGSVQDNPVLAQEVSIPPIIDGNGTDTCWQKVTWQSIAQVWIPYGTHVDSSDYSGRYKVVWSSTTNLLYFLIEVTDDVFVDGFIPGVTSDIYNFDITEIFIDEDKSGGLHVFDGRDSIGREWGTNAENAFSYHIYAAFPKEGQITTKLYAGDLDGTSWADVKSVNYTSHFPEFSLRKMGNTAVWEFSLIVYNDTYEDTLTDKNAARARLYTGKVMGSLSPIAITIAPMKARKHGITFSVQSGYRLLRTTTIGRMRIILALSSWFLLFHQSSLIRSRNTTLKMNSMIKLIERAFHE